MAKKQTTPTGNEPGSLLPSKAEDGFKEALDQRIGPLVPQQQRGEIVTRVYRMLASENFSGPVPHPRHLGWLIHDMSGRSNGFTGARSCGRSS